MTPADDAAIRRLLADYEAAWAANEAAALEPFWDADDPHPHYLAEEIETPLVTWPAVRGYFADNEGKHDAIHVSYTDIAVKTLGADHAQALFKMRWAIAFKPGGNASAGMGGDGRVAATLRRTSAGFRLCGWIEAPLAPILYVRRLYEAQALRLEG